MEHISRGIMDTISTSESNLYTEVKLYHKLIWKSTFSVCTCNTYFEKCFLKEGLLCAESRGGDGLSSPDEDSSSINP